MTQEAATETTKSLPPNFDLNELVERLILLEEIESRREQGANGETIYFEEMKHEVNSWRK